MNRFSVYLSLMVLLLAQCWLATAARAATTERPDSEMRELLRETIARASSFKDRFDAEVWLVDMSGRLAPYVKNPQERLHILRLVHQESLRFNLKPELVLAVMNVESKFDRYAISNVGAQGLMQVMPFWKKEIGKPTDNLTDIATNIHYGCAILSAYMMREHGNMIRALARYNGSLGQYWYPERVMDAWQQRWFVKY